MTEGDAEMGDVLTAALHTLGRGESRTIKIIPRETKGTVRLDVTASSGAVVEQWFVAIESGKAQVRRAEPETPEPEPDAVLRAGSELFDQLASGKERFVPLFFRNALIVEGQLGLVDLLGRLLFAGPPSGRHPRDFARENAGAP